MLPRVLLMHWILNINDIAKPASAYACGPHMHNTLKWYLNK